MAGPLVPSWLPDHHPFYVSAPTALRISQNFQPNRIFLNIPDSSRYSNLEAAVLSTATAYGLHPCMAKEESRLEVRMRKIVELILTCQYGFTDLSYAARMNMPFELGILLAWGKETFVITSRRTRTIKALSDLNFGDIEFHEGKARLLIEKFSKWIERTASSKRLKSSTLLTRYRRFVHRRRDSFVAGDSPLARKGFRSALAGPARDARRGRGRRVLAPVLRDSQVVDPVFFPAPLRPPARMWECRREKSA